MNVRFLASKEKKEIIEQLDEQFGISELPYLLIETGKEKIRGFSGTMSKDEIMELGRLARIEIIGLYAIKRELQGEMRLSFDATQILKDKITRNIVKINDEQLHEWIRGRDLLIKGEKGLVVIQHNQDFIGCGASNGEKIFNYIPKERRIRK
ncbi:hypothetical protein KW805_01545 [Candidatus Pacearchaeota archaeon]|nr:hypothetical protein [Candidatus Pacearchaeota archaeon]